MDVPGPRKEHGRAVPRTGGIALWATMCLGQIFGWLKLPINPPEWICLHGLALMGLLDDHKSLSPRVKALVGLGLAFTLAIPMAQAYAADRTAVVLMGFYLPTAFPFLYTLPLLVLWFWALPQSYNLIDGMDGLATGLAMIVLLSLQMGMRTGHGVFLLGVLLATFALNWPRARHFLGDSGAYFLGGLLGLLALKTKALIYPSHALWIFAYPILDTALVVATRVANRKPLGMGDRNHFHHHWGRLLGTHSAWAVPILWLQGCALATRPLHFRGSEYIAWTALVLVLGQGLFFFFLARKRR